MAHVPQHLKHIEVPFRKLPYQFLDWHVVVQLFVALRYKSEDRAFDS